MSKRFRPDPKTMVMVSAGWLFADLLLVLTTLFLATTAPGKLPACATESTITPRATLVPGQAVCTPTPILPPTPTFTPTPTLPCLERTPQSFTLSVDYVGLLNGVQSASDDVQNQVQAQPALQGRRAGIVLLFVGTPSDLSGVSTSNQIAVKVQDALKSLGERQIIFYGGTVYHPPLLSFGKSYSQVAFEVYLFALPGHCV